MRRAPPVAAVVALLIIAALVGFVRDFSGDFHWHVVLGNQILDERAVACSQGSSRAARKFKRGFATVVSGSREGTSRVVPLGSMARA
jgi:hypothetical protein